MNFKFAQLGAFLCCVFSIAVVMPAIGQGDLEPPVAIDSIFANDSYVLGGRGTVYHLWEHDKVIERYRLASLPAGEIPVDLSAAATNSISIQGVSTILLVVANPENPATGKPCHVYAYDLYRNNQLLNAWSISGVCGGIDVFAGSVASTAFVTTANDNELYSISLTSAASSPIAVSLISGSLKRAGSVAVDSSGKKWYVADTTGAGIFVLSKSSQGFRTTRIPGVNTSISSLRMAQNGQLYATDTSLRRVFRLVNLGGVMTPDILKSGFLHPVALTTYGKGFAVCDDAAMSVSFMDKNWNLLKTVK